MTSGEINPEFAGPTPPGGATSIEQGFTSLERIRASAERVFMNHDPNITKFQSSGFLAVPAVGATPAAGSVDTLPDSQTPDPARTSAEEHA